MRRWLLVLLLAVFIAPLVSADFTTSITVKSYPNSQARLNILNVNTLDSVQTMDFNISETGEQGVSYTSSLSTFAISLIVWKNDKIVVNIKSSQYGNISAGNSLVIDTLQAAPVTTPVVAPVANVTNTTSSATVNSTNVTIVNSTVDSSQSVNSTSGITGSVTTNSSLKWVSSISSFFSGGAFKMILKVVLYVVVILVALVLVFFLIRWINLRRGYGSHLVSKSRADTSAPRWGGDGTLSEAEKKIHTAQEEIRKAQDEINRIKNRKSEVRQAEERFAQAKRDLDRLRG